MPAIKGKLHTKEHNAKIGLSRIGKKHSDEARLKISLGNKGKKRTKETLIKMRLAHSGIRIKDRSLIKRQDRHDCPLYKEWRQKVWSRDKYACQKCGEAKGKINAHHIAGFIDFPEFRMEITNGITFCVQCHRDFHSKYGKKNNNHIQLQDFLSKKP